MRKETDTIVVGSVDGTSRRIIVVHSGTHVYRLGEYYPMKRIEQRPYPSQPPLIGEAALRQMRLERGIE